MSSVKAQRNKLERLNGTLDGLQQEWTRRNDKVKYLRNASATETSAAKKFQLEQQITDEDVHLQSLEQKIQDVEKQIEQVNLDLPQARLRANQPELSHQSNQTSQSSKPDRKRLKYTGKVQPKPGEQDPQTEQLLYPYLPSIQLVEAVNLAITLERPLLLKGEPGCGKTELARAVAYELGLPYEAWYIKSTSRARDGLYTYDRDGRLLDLAASGIDDEAAVRATNADSYVEWGPLGRAFRSDLPTVVLIDEIDKTDIDFPNDLLLELNKKRFEVAEVKQTSPIKKIQAKVTPIVFITSNDEKDLPDAFLRRCLFHYVEFPELQQLTEIVKAYFPVSPLKVVDTIIDRFVKLREEMQREGEAGKKVSTRELIDWVRAVLRHN